MPLVVGTFPVAPPDVWQPPPIEDPGRPSFTWTDPDGVVWDLSAPHEVHGFLTTEQVGGWGATPIELITDPIARGGVEVRIPRIKERRLTWPLHVYGDTHVEFTARRRALMRAFTMTSIRKRPGLLTVSRPDGDARCVEAWYEDGWGGNPGEDVRYANPVLTLFCPQGYWRSVEPEPVERVYDEGSGDSFLDPYPTVSSGQLIGDTVIDNAGDAEAWPVWTITGPATALTATNLTTGAEFILTYALDDGEVATIDTRSHRPLVRGPAGQSIVGSLNWPAAELWSLAPGANEVTFLVEGGGPGASIRITYYRQYESA